jgi:membrane protein CcdC involved in cytochrome C biogenesis
MMMMMMMMMMMVQRTGNATETSFEKSVVIGPHFRDTALLFSEFRPYRPSPVQSFPTHSAGTAPSVTLLYFTLLYHFKVPDSYSKLADGRGLVSHLC